MCMRTTLAALCLLLASASAYAGQEPIDHPTQTEKKVKLPKTELVVVGCRVDDLTGQPGRQDPALAAYGWRDLEWHVEGGELECKREVLALQDGTLDADGATADMIKLEPNWSDYGQCAHEGATQAARWDDHHKGWATMLIGCPVPIWNDNGTPNDKSDDYIVDFKLPECPAHQPGSVFPMRCRFDAGVI